MKRGHVCQMEKITPSLRALVCLDRLYEILRVAANTIIVLAGAYLIHELIQKLGSPCPDCYRARVVPDEHAGQDQADRDGAEAWPPTRVIRGAGSYSFAPGAGD